MAKLNRNYDKWEEWQKIAYPLCHNQKELASYEMIEEVRIGRNYVFLIKDRACRVRQAFFYA